MLNEEESSLHDAEALSVLPFLINEVLGHNKVQFRDSAKAILRTACNLWPSSKVRLAAARALLCMMVVQCVSVTPCGARVWMRC